MGKLRGANEGGIIELFGLGHMIFEVTFRHLYYSEFNQRSRTTRIYICTCMYILVWVPCKSLFLELSTHLTWDSEKMKEDPGEGKAAAGPAAASH